MAAWPGGEAFVTSLVPQVTKRAMLSVEDAALLELVLFLRDSDYRFSTVTPLTHARVNARPQAQMATDIAGVFGWSRPFGRDAVPEHILAVMRRADVLDEHGADMVRSRVRVSTMGALTFVHSAFPTTEADSVFFGPDTIRFVDAILRPLGERTTAPKRVADVGCGAGPGGIAVGAAVPGAEVTLLDINARALRYARVNAQANGVRADTYNSDILSATEGAFDFIVSNPPYLVDRSLRAYRHGGGRFGEGLSLRILVESLPRLAPGGTLLLYTGTAVVAGEDVFLSACRELLDATGLAWSYREVDPDVFGEELETPAYVDVDRIAAVVLTVTN